MATMAVADSFDGLNLWEVVGGEDRGGILVREGLDISSSRHEQRLSTGALLEELSLLGERLYYRRLTGTGPDHGWVSIKLPHKDLVVRRRRNEPPADRRVVAAAEPAVAEDVACQAQPPTAACASAPSSARPADGAPLGGPPPGHGAGRTRRLLESRLLAGSRQLRGAFCGARDLGLFEALRVELKQGVRPFSGNWAPSSSGKWRTPWRNGMGSEQVEDLQGRSLSAHAAVLQRLAEAFNAEVQMWWTNFYEDGSVGCDFHHDGHACFNITAGASFGAARDLSFVHPGTGCTFAFRQENGDVFAFDESVDSAFEHGVFPAEAAVGPRISVIMMGRTKGSSISTQLESLRDEWHDLMHGSPSTIAWLLSTVRRLQLKRRRQLETISGQLAVLGRADHGADVAEPSWSGEEEPECIANSSLLQLHDTVKRLQDTVHRQQLTIREHEQEIGQQRARLEDEAAPMGPPATAAGGAQRPAEASLRVPTIHSPHISAALRQRLMDHGAA